MAPSSAASSLLIKGFLPVRLKLPGCNHFLQKSSGGDGLDKKEKEDETFFFVKPHVVSNNNNKNNADGAAAATAASSSSNSSKALFVVNVPTVPGIRTKVLLKSLLGRFGDVERVTVVENPRNNNSSNATTKNKLIFPITVTNNMASSSSSSSYSPVVVPSAWSKPLYYPTCLPPMLSEGKFAHVEFTSAKEMKRAMKVLKEIMSEPPQQSDDDDDDGDDDENDNEKNSKSYPALRLEKLEIQTLMDETQRQYIQSVQNFTNGDNDDDRPTEEDDDDDTSKPPLTGILTVAERYRASLRRVSSARSAMLEECNAVMASFEESEESNQRAREAAAHVPDDDGFVTVTYSNTASVTNDLEMAKNAAATAGQRRGANQRHRKKKESTGASQLADFYRFQRKENRKRDLQDLRQKFEEDLARVKRMKEDQQYRPFR